MVLFSLHKKNAISRRSQSELQTMNGDPLYCRTLKGNDRAQSAVACVKRGAGEDEASNGASAQRMAYGLCRCGWIAMRRIAARSKPPQMP
jgi:hypothetical protein